jgi:hypothetical protein
MDHLLSNSGRLWSPAILICSRYRGGGGGGGGGCDIVFQKRVYWLQREAEHTLHLMSSVRMCSYMRTLPSHGDEEYRNYRFKSQAIKIHLSLQHKVCLKTVQREFSWRVRCSASCFNFQCLFSSWRSPSSCLRLLPCLTFSFYLPVNNVFRRQFLRNVWPLQLAFLLYCLHSAELYEEVFLFKSSFVLFYVECSFRAWLFFLILLNFSYDRLSGRSILHLSLFL